MDFPDDLNFPNAMPVPNHGMLHPNLMQINIDHCYKDYPLTIDSSITVSELKYSIQPLLGVPAGKQHMLFNGQLLRDYERLNERPDIHRSTINVHEGILIVAKTISEEMQIVVKESDIIQEVKRKIAVHFKLPIERMRLVFKDVQLLDLCPLWAYGIDEGALT